VTALEVSGLVKCFGAVRAVDGASFAVAEGEIVALIGPNGAGKTTCFNALNGQLRPEDGRVRLDGRDITGLPPRRMARLGVGRTFQVTQTYASMSVRENVQLALAARHGRVFAWWPRLGDLYREEALALLEPLGMAGLAERPCGLLAYGDLKRVELAVALAGAPRLLLMDEPTAGMAATERLTLMALVARLARARRLSVLFTEHDMDVVFGHADRVLVLDRGRVIADGPLAAVRADPRVRAVYLGDDPGAVA
jgi:branched-chain amino acid transport system ATP-binding protein